jgi:glycerol-3-phosphate acyltransferase PlsY
VSFGSVLVVSPPAAAAAFASGVTALAVSRRMSVLSLVGAGFAVATSVAVGVRRHDATDAALVIPTVAIIVFRHRENINRLLRGVEPEVDIAAAGPPAAAAPGTP